MITLLSDFGLTDPYVAQMKGVIRSINSQVDIVDISHGIEKHNIAMGSFMLMTTALFFPTGTIHVAVIDPGVGGSRLPIVVDCDHGILVGPDNGLLAFASDKLGFQDAFRISDQKFVSEKPSSTFHGRDIFAQVAAKIALGSKPSDVGPRVPRIVRLDISTPVMFDDGIQCRVLYVDSFGNVITNISDEMSRRSGIEGAFRFSVAVKDRTYEGVVVKSYHQLSPGQIGLLLGSQGYLEIAIREGSAAEKLRVRSFDQLKVRFK